MRPEEELEIWIKNWKEDVEVYSYISIPFFFVYFPWWSRNNAIFQNSFIPCEVVAGLTVKLVGEYKVKMKQNKVGKPSMTQIADGIP
jgi:hypothetical protein